jgi:hypothetical protein
LAERYRLRLAKTNGNFEPELTPWGSVFEPVDDFVLAPLLRWKAAIVQAKRFLRDRISGDFFVWVSGYIDFTRRVFWNIENYGRMNAVSHVQTDIDLFVSWGFSEDVLRELAGLQGLSL